MAGTLTNELAEWFDSIDSIDGVNIELKNFFADLEQRVKSLDDFLPGSAKPSHSQTSSVFAYLSEFAEYAKDVAEESGIDVNAEVEIEGQMTPLYDFSVPSYADFIATEQAIRDEISATMPDFPGNSPLFSGTLINTDPASLILSKLLSALGIAEAVAGFWAALEATAGSTWKAFLAALKAGQWKTVGRLLVQLLKVIMSKAFLTALANAIGEAAAKKIIGKIAAKSLPFIGWAILVASFIWAFAEQADWV